MNSYSCSSVDIFTFEHAFAHGGLAQSVVESVDSPKNQTYMQSVCADNDISLDGCPVVEGDLRSLSGSFNSSPKRYLYRLARTGGTHGSIPKRLV